MIECSTYKDKPVMTIKDNDKQFKRITFGLTKAKLILGAVKGIEQFIKDNEVKEA